MTKLEELSHKQRTYQKQMRWLRLKGTLDALCKRRYIFAKLIKVTKEIKGTTEHGRVMDIIYTLELREKQMKKRS